MLKFVLVNLKFKYFKSYSFSSPNERLFFILYYLYLFKISIGLDFEDLLELAGYSITSTPSTTIFSFSLSFLSEFYISCTLSYFSSLSFYYFYSVYMSVYIVSLIS